MFENPIIVQSAVSAFNNAALFAPAFLWWAFLAAPLFAMAYFCGGAFLTKLGWTKQNMIPRACLTVVSLVCAWVVLFGGNYGVLRDATSMLPFLIAAIVFLAMLFIGSHMRDVKIPQLPRGLKTFGLIFILMAVALSDTHTWWGPILQIAAFVGGFICGRFVVRGKMRALPGTLLIIMASLIAILMQPEFFRFGQLGSLTFIHLGGLMLTAAAAAATCALRSVAPRARIHRSAYVKLKWMARFVSLLCIAMFMLTESVPVLIGAFVAWFLMFAMSVYHSEKVSAAMSDKMFFLTIGLFGVLTTMPAITALGIVCWASIPGLNSWRDWKFLL